MAITQYQCTICKRVRDVAETDKTLTLTTMCTITQGCRGSLIKFRRLPNTTRESTPRAVDSLVDWQQRNVLWDHTQRIAAAKWRIAHPINVPFTAIVVVEEDGAERQLERDEFDLQFTDQNLATLTFDSAKIGTAQFVARNGSRTKVYEAPSEEELVQVSHDSRLIFFDSSSQLDAGTSTLRVELVLPDGTAYQGDQTISTDGLERTPWHIKGVLFNDIAEMKVLCLHLEALFIVPAIGTIPDGSRLNILQLYGRRPRRHELMLGLAHDPNRVDPFNRNKMQMVDTSRLVGGIVIRNGEAYVYESNVETITPPLRMIP